MKKVAYLGIPGSNSYIAAKKYFVHDTKFISCESIADGMNSVANKYCHYAVVPIENSTTGSILEMYDDLLKVKSVFIIGEIYLHIHHNIIGYKSHENKWVCYSHIQAFSQCKNYLKKLNIDKQYTSDTAFAVKQVSEKKTNNSIAIGSALAARLYKLKILKKNIEDTKHNYTRFVILAREANTKGEKVSLVYSLRHIPGSLYHSLAPFARYGLNLTKIESRPFYTGKWEYHFFVDLEAKDSKKMSLALFDLKKETKSITVLGFYKKGKYYET
jgi:prephenate dehydratase